MNSNYKYCAVVPNRSVRLQHRVTKDVSITPVNELILCFEFNSVEAMDKPLLELLQLDLPDGTGKTVMVRGLLSRVLGDVKRTLVRADPNFDSVHLDKSIEWYSRERPRKDDIKRAINVAGLDSARSVYFSICSRRIPTVRNTTAVEPFSGGYVVYDDQSGSYGSYTAVVYEGMEIAQEDIAHAIHELVWKQLAGLNRFHDMLYSNEAMTVNEKNILYTTLIAISCELDDLVIAELLLSIAEGYAISTKEMHLAMSYDYPLSAEDMVNAKQNRLRLMRIEYRLVEFIDEEAMVAHIGLFTFNKTISINACESLAGDLGIIASDPLSLKQNGFYSGRSLREWNKNTSAIKWLHRDKVEWHNTVIRDDLKDSILTNQSGYNRFR